MSDFFKGEGMPMEAEFAPATATREQTIRRLQVGLFGLGVMILVVGLADVATESAAETAASTLPDQATSEFGQQLPAPRSDPLAEAGVIPDIPAEPAEPARDSGPAPGR